MTDLPTQPLPANDPVAVPTEPPPLTLVGPELFGPQGLLAIDAVLSERLLNWERRRVVNEWRWRAPRGSDGPSEWQREPVRFSAEPGIALHFADAEANRQRLDLQLRTQRIPLEADKIGRAYLVLIGEARPNGFWAKHRAIATTLPLACALVTAEMLGASIGAMREELFGNSGREFGNGGW